MGVTEADQPSRRIGATEKACQILRVLHREDGAGITEITGEIGLSKGTVHTHLATLVAHEFVVKEGDQYYPSLKFLEIGEDLKRRHSLYTEGRTELKTLAMEEKARTQIVVEQFGMAVALHNEQSPEAVAPPVKIGKRDYLHTNAAGKCILANLPEERVESIIQEHGLPALTEKTITDRGELERELERVRESGVAFNDEENMRGLRAVGAPVIDSTGTVHGSVSISVPARGLPTETFREEYPAKISSLANRIELNLNLDQYRQAE